MASGYYDAQGIWHYGEDDTDATAWDMLNRLADSVSAALAALPRMYEFDLSGQSVAAGSTKKVTHTFPPGTFTSPPRMYGGITVDYRDVTVSFETITKDSVVVVLGSVGAARAGISANILARAR